MMYIQLAQLRVLFRKHQHNFLLLMVLLPLAYVPPKAVPFQTLPVTSWNGLVDISCPDPATPMIVDTPQPL